MDQSIFTDKSRIPSDDELLAALGKTCGAWHLIKDYVFAKFPAAIEEWNFPGEKYGWSNRIRLKKRTILYLLPREGFFKVAFVFGQKAADQIAHSQIQTGIKKELETAHVYAEGRGIRIDIKDSSLISDIKELIDIKLAS
jgi:hypothetical protein